MDNTGEYEKLLDKLDLLKNDKGESESDEYKVLDEAILAIKDLQARLGELLGNRITEHLDEPDATSIW